MKKGSKRTSKPTKAATRKSDSRAQDRWLVGLGGAVFLALIGWGVWIGLQDPNAPPDFSKKAIDKNLRAGYTENVVGNVFARNYLETESPSELELPSLEDAAPKGEGWRRVRPGRQPLYLQTILFVPRGSRISVSLASSWTTQLAGALAAIEDSRVDLDTERFTVFWWLKFGDFRTRTHQAVTKETWARIRMDRSHIDVRTIDKSQAQLSIGRNSDGNGNIVLKGGRAVYHRRDGEKIKLSEGLNRL